MFQFFLKSRRVRHRRPTPGDEQRYADDPLSHPELRRMRPHELADIPFPRPEPLQDAQSRDSSG